jgi:hypothetical protein
MSSVQWAPSSSIISPLMKCKRFQLGARGSLKL